LIPIRTALVTGGSGFVGTELCRSLLAHGWSVRSDNLRLMEDTARWQASLRSISCVVHLAARVHQMGADREGEIAYHRINVEGSRFLAEQAANAGVRRFVFLSSVKVNGDGAARPYRDTDSPAPCDPYGRSKYAAEQAIKDICEQRGMECVVIRPPLVYGPGVRANFHKLLRLVDLGIPLPLGSIENQRSLIGLTNLVYFIETCMTHPRGIERTWLIADEESISTPELLRRMARHMNRTSRLFRFPPGWLRRLGEAFNMQAQVDRLCGSLLLDATPAFAVLDWRPTASLDEELARTVAAFRRKRVL
jgi:nucleoside-diphosphate-sugar epimerase